MATWAVPFEVRVQPVLVGWCPQENCNSVYDPYPGRGSTCDNEHEWELWAYERYGNGGTRGLLKRRMYKCPTCDLYLLNVTGYRYHEHEWF
jgi:hypothetical protein